jgi:quercetin dioxygenase-like cupin family protein
VSAPSGDPVRRIVAGHQRDVAAVARPGRTVQPFVSGDEGATRLAAGVVTFPAGTDSIPHTHADHEEILYVVSGGGQLVCDGQPVALERGSYVFIPPGVEHLVRNDRDEEITFFYAFSPPIVIGTW